MMVVSHWSRLGRTRKLSTHAISLPCPQRRPCLFSGIPQSAEMLKGSPQIRPWYTSVLSTRCVRVPFKGSVSSSTTSLPRCLGPKILGSHVLHFSIGSIAALQSSVLLCLQMRHRESGQMRWRPFSHLFGAILAGNPYRDRLLPMSSRHVQGTGTMDYS